MTTNRVMSDEELLASGYADEAVLKKYGFTDEQVQDARKRLGLDREPPMMRARGHKKSGPRMVGRRR